MFTAILANIQSSWQAFEHHALEYDAWYDTGAGRVIFAMEVGCLKPLIQKYPGPCLEIGVGPGRFAQALGIEFGADPALSLLRMAKARSILVVKAVGEGLPFPDASFTGVLIALTLCFVDEPERVLEESGRVLRHEGGLMLGLIVKGSPWEEFYRRKGKEGHPIYSKARFFSKEEIESLLQLSGFEVLGYRSTLFQPPYKNRYYFEQALTGYSKSAGFVAIESCKR